MSNQSDDRQAKAVMATSESLIDTCQRLGFAAAMIEQLRGGSIHRAPLKQVSEMMDALLRGIPYAGYQLSAEFRAMRGRITKQSEGEKLFELSSEFSYRPAQHSHDFGRCHQPGTTIFYGALNLDTVIAEIAPEVGDRVHVGVAKVRAGQQLCVTAIGEIDHVRRYGGPLVGNAETTTLLNQLLDSFPEEQKVRALLVDAFFADLFSQPAQKQRDYKATSALASLLLEAQAAGKEVLDGFYYPSVAHRGGLNVAIRPDKFDALLEWEHFMCFEITDYLGFGLYGRRQIASAMPTPASGCINWELTPRHE